MNDGRKNVDADLAALRQATETTDEWAAANTRSAGDAVSNNLFERWHLKLSILSPLGRRAPDLRRVVKILV